MIPGVSDAMNWLGGAMGVGDKSATPDAGTIADASSSFEDAVPDSATVASTGRGIATDGTGYKIGIDAGDSPAESAVSGAVQAVQQNVQQVTRTPQVQLAGGGGSGNMSISGTLSLSGLQEAIMSAQGQQVIQTEGGAPVVADPMLSRSAGPAPVAQYTTPINHLNPAPVTG
jgi:hypothetical protein